MSEGIDYLQQLIRQVDPEYKTIAFKGGSWGLQPSENLFNLLGRNGIRIVMGVRNDLRLPKSGTDYTNTEERVMPYYPDYKDIRKVSDKTEMSVFVIDVMEKLFNGFIVQQVILGVRFHHQWNPFARIVLQPVNDLVE